MTVAGLFLSFLALIALEVPVAFSLGLSSLLYLLVEGRTPFVILAQKMTSGLDSFPFLALPFFVLAGNIFSRGGIARRIYDFARAVERPMLTDSGGFQVYSLAARRKITEEGASFQSHLDGSRHAFTPERAVEVQEALGADVIMAFDECPPALADRRYHEEALLRTQRWLERCRVAWLEAEARKADHAGPDPVAGGPAPPGAGPAALFGIAQGGLFADLRRRAVEAGAALDLPGYALGGYGGGEEAEVMWEGVARDAPLLPREKPRYLMGVGMPEDLLQGAAAGVDLSDCVLPTRCARNGLLFTSRGRLVIRNARWADDERPVDADSPCYGCRTFSRAYLRHLFKSGEILGLRLNTLHNLTHYLSLMAEAGANSGLYF